MDLRQIHMEDVLVTRLDEFECQGQGHQGQISSPLKMHCKVLAANNVKQ